MLGWGLLAITIIFEVLGTISMKMSMGLTRLIPSILIFVFYGICFSTFAIAVRKIDLGLAYAIWSGIGTLIITVVGVFYFKETINLFKMVSILFIIIGLIGLKISAGH